jgi:archaellum biogenesis ATPase FlaH
LKKDYEDNSYPVEKQKYFLRMMLTNAELFTRVTNIYNAINFDKSIRPVAEFIKHHADEYKILPEFEQVEAVTGIKLDPIQNLNQGHYDWFLEQFEKFTKRQELERAILKSADLLEKGEYDPVEKLIKDAVQISLQKDMGMDYFADPRGRLLALKSNNGQVSTGWPSMDKKLYGGFNRGELQIFAGGSGSGKSLFMQNLAVNWTSMGLNGVYITLELSEGLCSMRIDSMTTETSSREIFKSIDDIEMKIKMMSKKYGKFRVKYMPAQSNVNDIRAYCKELQIQTGMNIDFLCIDYLDLLMPVSAKVSPSDLFVKDKYVAEEVRNLAKELNVLLVTASQLNRSAVEEIEFDHSHISGGISKINTADNVFGIFTSRSMRERGQYQLQLMKTRSSSGVGQKIELEFNVETLRITDPDPEGYGEQQSKFKPSPSPNDIMNRLKPQSTIVSTEPIVDQNTGEVLEPSNKKVVVDVQGSKLKTLLNSLKK